LREGPATQLETIPDGVIQAAASTLVIANRRQALAPLPGIHGHQFLPQRCIPGPERRDAGFSIDVPALTLLPSRDCLQPRWTKTATEADVALNVDVVAHHALSLGNNVSVLRIKAVDHIFLFPCPGEANRLSGRGALARRISQHLGLNTTSSPSRMPMTFGPVLGGQARPL
jgi:hypothetical protein